MCGSVIEAVQDMAKDVLGTSSPSRSDAAEPVDDLFASTDLALGDDAGTLASQLQDMAGDLFGDIGTSVTAPEPAAEPLSGYGASSGLTDAGQIVIPEGYSPPAFAIETTALTDSFGGAPWESTELDPSMLITEPDFDIATAFDMAIDATAENGWNDAAGSTDILGITPINYDRV